MDATNPDSNAWRSHLLTEPTAIHAALAAVHTIAVLGIKPADTDAPAFYVPERWLPDHPCPGLLPEHALRTRRDGVSVIA
jgi:hypothetical protein